MAKRKLIGVHKAEYEPIGNLVTYKAMPNKSVEMNRLDPFIFLNHHGWQHFLPMNGGLPFGPHPHRGFETVTFILEGDLTHKDSGSGANIIKEGGIQWMTAGSGLIHAEVSSREFMVHGGNLEILQLWINLPARYKMTPPKYIGLQKDQIPVWHSENEEVTVQVIAGEWWHIKGPVEPFTDIHLATFFLKKDGSINLNIAAQKTIFLYVVKGHITVNDTAVPMRHLAEFAYEGEELLIQSSEDAIVLLGHATPFREPLFAYGPFVMNSREEIMQAYDDYHKGKLGSEEELMRVS